MVPQRLLRVCAVLNQQKNQTNQFVSNVTVLYNNQNEFKDLEKWKKSHNLSRIIVDSATSLESPMKIQQIKICWIFIGGYKAQDTFDKKVTDTKQSKYFQLRKHQFQAIIFTNGEVLKTEWPAKSDCIKI